MTDRLPTTSAMHCPICNNAAEPAFSGRTWSIGHGGRAFGYQKCPACELIFCDPMPTEAELTEYYATSFDYGWYERRRLQKRVQGYHRWRYMRWLIERHAGAPGRLLDIGCGYGWFLDAARRSGWRVAGIELSPESVDFATRRLSLDVALGAIETMPPPEQQFDAITLWHSLEHMRDPRKTLAWIGAALRPNGAVLIAVPNVASRGLRRRGPSWIWLQQPFVHLWHFSDRALGLLLAQAGLRALDVRTRDTWDAQYLYDGVLAPQLEGRYFRKLALETEKALAKLKIAGAKQAGANMQMALSETSRLLAYGLTQIPNAIARQHPGDGSELLVLAGHAV